LCDCIENGSLVLLDEPETHLHPNLISSFCSLLEKTLRATGSSAVIATHSAYFVREVFREQVTVINRTGNFTEIVKPRLRTFGADIGAISRFVFGEEDESRLAHQLMRQIVSHEADWDTVYTKYKDELSMELLGAIRDEMESKEVSE
ncbi:TPA: AAA family ATPase, partial [Stenotrophomonas maltophilia]|nr:AAA family ATPase [Stenotrophomonas maltophilia]HDS1659408.1 AAA family ATPase [Stenotrophomonas maltophilia]HDS1673291.1 AAA family ATPase [Stenotrophomonas maltophilia]